MTRTKIEKRKSKARFLTILFLLLFINNFNISIKVSNNKPTIEPKVSGLVKFNMSTGRVNLVLGDFDQVVFSGTPEQLATKLREVQAQYLNECTQGLETPGESDLPKDVEQSVIDSL